jgi:hypothetical protein
MRRDPSDLMFHLGEKARTEPHCKRHSLSHVRLVGSP